MGKSEVDAAALALPVCVTPAAPIRTMQDRLTAVVASEVERDTPPHQIVMRVLHTLRNATDDMIVQGCHALANKQRELCEAKWSGDRHLFARTKMKYRWRAMVKAIEAGM